MINVKAIHQFTINLSDGDGISNGIRFTQRLLRQAGLESEIFIPDTTQGAQGTLPLSSYRSDDNQLLLIHHGIGNGFERELRALQGAKIMVFHNITPAAFFPPNHPIQPMLTHGWEQVRGWREWLTGTIADSDHNRQVLLKYGYNEHTTFTIPLLVDFESLTQSRAVSSARPLDEDFRLLFVGRLQPHKNQLTLIDTLHELNNMTAAKVRLILAGSAEPDYLKQIQHRIDQLQLGDQVTLAGKVSDTTLATLYASADLYVSPSRHEGFGMPLIEAMGHGLPVLAYKADDTSIEETVGGGGLLTDSDSPKSLAATIATLIDEPILRAGLRHSGYQRIKDFSPERLYHQFSKALHTLGYTLPALDTGMALTVSKPVIRLEGPFDSSYSLAIVNHQLARALNRIMPGQVALHSTEGPGDFPADENFLRQYTETQAMVAHPDAARAEIVMRLMYPPRVTGMNGLHNGLTCYGWEESLLPSEFMQNFSRHLQFVTSMSNWVSDTLISNGLTCPVHTIGIGADHILESPETPEQLPELGEGLRILHVSSCFPRKGIDVLLASVADAFANAQDKQSVTLIIKTFPNPHHDIQATLKQWRKQYPHAPRVVLINKDLPPGAIRSLYQQSHVLVAPSRGEGFGLPMAEAMLHKLPVIVTGYGGQTDFCRDDTAWLIDYHFARAQTHMGLGESVWVEPSQQHLTELLQTFALAFNDPADWNTLISKRTAKAEQLIRQEYSWDAVAQRLHPILAGLKNQYKLRKRPRLGCVTTWNSKCGIATYANKLLTPALEDCTILANTNAELTAADSANVFRCWESGTKDTLEKLYNRICQQQLDVVLIQFNFSFFGLPALKRLLGRLHEKGIKVLITFHSTADVYWGSELKTLRDLLPELADVSRIMVHSVHDLNQLKTFGLSRNTLLFPHGVDRVQTQSLQCPDQSWSTNLGSYRIIASYGFLLPHKGVRQLIEVQRGSPAATRYPLVAAECTLPG
jgi:glycosyltransferase involved in cell wall biosynthesis